MNSFIPLAVAAATALVGSASAIVKPAQFDPAANSNLALYWVRTHILGRGQY